MIGLSQTLKTTLNRPVQKTAWTSISQIQNIEICRLFFLNYEKICWSTIFVGSKIVKRAVSQRRKREKQHCCFVGFFYI